MTNIDPTVNAVRIAVENSLVDYDVLDFDTLYSRQEDFVPQEKITTAMVVGTGAIGRQVAILLSRMGCHTITLVDPQRVDLSNVSSQGFSILDVGDEKTAAVKRECCLGGVNTISICDYYRSARDSANPANQQVVFCCVDNMSVRKVIFEQHLKCLSLFGGIKCPYSEKSESFFFCDGRMLGENLRILTAADHNSRRYYLDPENLYTTDQAEKGSCTSKTTLYAAYIIAGRMVHMYSRWLRNLPVDYDVLENVLASEVTVLMNGQTYEEERQQLQSSQASV